MVIKIHPENPQPKRVQQVAEIVRNGGIIIYPTDSVFAVGCDIHNKQAVERVCQLRGLDPTTAMLTFMCSDISQLSQFSAQLSKPVFKLIKHNTPGPFTFILKSDNSVPKMFKNKKRTIGARICSHPVILSLIETLGNPILSSSLKFDDQESEYFNMIDEVIEKAEKRVDAIIDSGTVPNVPTAVVDCTEEEAVLVRKGIKELV